MSDRLEIGISARSASSRKPYFTDWRIPLPPDDFGDDGLTLRDVITRVVCAEVKAYEQRREERRLDRVLTQRQIDVGIEQGRIAPEARQVAPAPELDVAVGTALQAFEDGLYLVIIDGTEHRDLDARVFLQPNSAVVFIRLTFLAGG